MKTDKLIDELADSGEAIEKLCPYKCCFKWLMLVMLAIAVVSFFVLGLRSDIEDKMDSSLYLAELIIALATGLMASLAVHWLSFPDICQKKWIIWLPVVPFTMLAFLIIYHFLMQPVHLSDADFSPHCITDIISIVVVPIVLFCVLLIFLRKAATTHAKLTSMMAVLAVGSFGYFCARLVCPEESLGHLLVWHYTPIVVISVIGVLVGTKLLRW